MTTVTNASETIKNLESALAGESMAHIKYTYFAKICRAMGDEETAIVFENTAKQEVMHALGHMDLLFPKQTLDPKKCLDLAIEGETYEYTTMYPEFRHTAHAEGESNAVKEFDEQIEESKEHAEMFQQILVKAEKRFAALAKVEERHANHYQQTLNNIA